MSPSQITRPAEANIFKIILTCRRRAGLSFDQFKSYYHDHHLPNVFAILPPSPNGATVHRRNFIMRDDPILGVIGDGRADTNPPFDVITEIEFETREDAHEAMRTMFEEQYIEQIKADEANFIDPGSINFYVTEVHENRLK
jgi:hypothetical protein